MSDSHAATKQIDLSRAPLGAKAAAALVEAVTASDDRVERHYLEVKSDLDLAQKNDIAKIAKFILGSANRLPSVARAAFEGHGVMVIGVAPGDARGVPPVEVLELDKIIRQYLGASGPRWDVVRVPTTSSNEVLIVVVDPPQEGQDPFLCRRQGESLSNGRVYVRADGETREANAEELDLLLKRGKYQAAPDVSFEVEIVGTVYPVEINNTRTIDDFIERTKTRLINALPRPELSVEEAAELSHSEALSNGISVRAMQDLMKMSALAGGVFGSEPEKRTEDQYRASIKRWEEQARAQWLAAPDTLAGESFDGVVVRVSNSAKTFFHDVEVKVHLEGPVRGISWEDGEIEFSKSTFDLPSAPRTWGPAPRTPFNAALLNTPHYFSPANIGTSYRSPLDWNNSGSVDMTLDVGDLRPKQTFSSDGDELVLVLPLTDEHEVRGTWEITARDHNEIYTGNIVVPIGPPVDFTETARKILDLE